MRNGLHAQGLVDTYPPDVPALVARKCFEGMQVVSMNLILTNETRRAGENRTDSQESGMVHGSGG